MKTKLFLLLLFFLLPAALSAACTTSVTINVTPTPVNGSVVDKEQLTIPPDCDGRTDLTIQWIGAAALIAFDPDTKLCENGSVFGGSGLSCRVRKIPHRTDKIKGHFCPVSEGQLCFKYTVITTGGAVEDPKVIMDGKAIPLQRKEGKRKD
jgi:hypothetical protein